MHSSFAKQSAEMFQGIYADGIAVYTLNNLVENLFSTKAKRIEGELK